MGGNLGDTERLLRAAIQQLRSALRPLRVAPLYRTRPLNGRRSLAAAEQPPYLNTAVIGRALLGAADLLGLAKALERAAGRRRGPRHGSRPLDVDLLLYGQLVSDLPELTLPHPGLRQRRFVLAPLAAIAPELPIPPDGMTVGEALSRVGQHDEVQRIEWRQPP